MARRRTTPVTDTPQARLSSLVDSALHVTKVARRNAKSLTGDNHYANKLAQLRTQATNCFRDLDLLSPSPGDSSTLAGMLEIVFSGSTSRKVRLSTSRELKHALATTWRQATTTVPTSARGAVFPAELLEATGRGYLITVGRQMNECFTAGWYDACAVMMRRLLETVIVDGLEERHISDRFKDGQGNYPQLSGLIGRVLAESSLPLTRNTRAALPRLRDAGHYSAHSRYYTAQEVDIERIQPDARIAIEEFLRLAGLI